MAELEKGNGREAGDWEHRLLALLEKARAGDAAALESLLREIQTPVYNFALRMLWHPDDAADACQEILVKVVTALAQFRGESKFMTWVYRIAVNHALRMRKSRVEREEIGFHEFAENLERGITRPPPGAVIPADADHGLLEEEVKLGCMTGMLLCLDREHRAAYILGEIFQVTGAEGAVVMEIEAAAFRKRLSRAREKIRAFMSAHCGLVNTNAPCRCSKQIAPAIAGGRVRPAELVLAGHARSTKSDEREAKVRETEAGVREMDELERAAGLFRAHPEYAAPGRFTKALRDLIAGGRFRVFGDN